MLVTSGDSNKDQVIQTVTASAGKTTDTTNASANGLKITVGKDIAKMSGGSFDGLVAQFEKQTMVLGAYGSKTVTVDIVKFAGTVGLSLPKLMVWRLFLFDESA